MRFLIALLFVAFTSPACATVWHPVAAVAAVVAKSTGGGGGGAVGAVGGGGSAIAAGTWAVGGFVAGVGAAALWCGLNQPKRNWRRDVWVDGRADVNPTYTPRPDGCLFKRDPPVRVRG